MGQRESPAEDLRWRPGNRFALRGRDENARHAIAPPAPVDAITERTRDLGVSRADLGGLLGVGSGRVSEILNRRRALTTDMVRRLAAGLGLSERCLVQPHELSRECA